MAVVTCHTAGCENADVPIVVDLSVEDGLDPPTVVCGPCAQPITDVAGKAKG